MHVHVSLSSTFGIKISGWTKAIKSTEMNLETFQFYYFTSILSEKKGEGIITLVMHILKELSVLFKLTVGVLLIVNLWLSEVY